MLFEKAGILGVVDSSEVDPATLAIQPFAVEKVMLKRIVEPSKTYSSISLPLTFANNTLVSSPTAPNKPPRYGSINDLLALLNHAESLVNIEDDILE
eukprot:c6595_g1_i1 orf=227-517(+)